MTGGHVGVPNQSAGVQLFFYVNTFFGSNKIAWLLAT